MTYPYTVKVDGKWYPANTEIPQKKATAKKTKGAATEEETTTEK